MSADEKQVGGNHYKDMPLQPWTVMQAGGEALIVNEKNIDQLEEVLNGIR